MSFLIKNGRIVDPITNTDEILDLLIENGKIVKKSKSIRKKTGTEVLDASNLVICPGFIDMHVHFREPGQEYKEDIQSGTSSAVAGGFTAVACMANTDPINDSSSITERILKKAREVGYCKVYPIGSVSVGLKGEKLSELSDQFLAGAVAFSDDGFPVKDSFIMRSALEYSKMLGVAILDHAEDMSLSKDKVMHEGVVSTTLGLSANPDASEDICVYRDLRLAELTGGKIHILHVSSKGAVDLIRNAKKKGVNVTCEVTPHHFSLTDEEIRGFNSSYKMAPPLRDEEHRMALIDGLKDGTIDVIASDHAPHDQADLEVEFDRVPFGVVGLETAVPIALDRLVQSGILTLSEMIEKFTSGPSKAIGIPCAKIEEGSFADLTILDLEKIYTVIPNDFKSRAKNTPFSGWELKGCPVATIVDGVFVMNNVG
ncbi:MAG: dihydroorotase [Nitrospinota bacterium]|nr:dihydroorotase [Nitrospinota bacterium]